MKRLAVLLVIVLLAVLAVLAAVWWGDAPAPRGAADANDAVPLVREAPARSRNRAEPPSALEVREPVPSPQSQPVPATPAGTASTTVLPFPLPEPTALPERMLRGRVTDASGAPVSRARVILTSTWLEGPELCAVGRSRSTLQHFPQIEYPHQESVCVSDGQGRFEVAYRPGGPRCLHVIAGERRWFSQSVGDDAFVEVVLPSGGVQIGGRVVDVDGRPVPAAIVRVLQLPALETVRAPFWHLINNPVSAPSTVSDATGAWVVEGVAAGPAALEVTAEGFAPLREAPLDIPPSGIDDLTIRVGGGFVIRGRVVDAATSAPVKGALVLVATATWRRSSHCVVTDGKGRFRIEHVHQALGTYLALTAEAHGYVDAHRLVLGADEGGSRQVEISVSRAARIRVCLVDGAGEPLVGALVSARTHHLHEPAANEGHRVNTILTHAVVAISDANGVAVVHVSAGKDTVGIDLRIQHAGAWVHEQGVGVPKPGTETDLGSVTIAAPLSLRGRVVSALGAPASGVQVIVVRHVRGSGSEALAGRILGERTHVSTTDTEGRYGIAGLSTDLWDVFVTGEEVPDLLRTGVSIAADLELDLRLPHGAELAGTVLDASGAPVKGAAVFVMRNHPLPFRLLESRTTDAEGRFAFPPFPRAATDVEVFLLGEAGFDPEKPTVRVSPAAGPVELRIGE